MGEGGYGLVLAATQLSTGAEVVVKILRHVQDRARFEREVRSLVQVSHPNLVRVLDAKIEDDGLMWIAMERVRGVTLRTCLVEHGPMSLGDVVELIGPIAEVVQDAHNRGIVHRDLKPDNVMVAEVGGRLVPKLLDFGLAKFLDDEIDLSSSDGVDESEESDAPLGTDGISTNRDALLRGYAHGREPGTWPYMAPEMFSDPASAGPTADVYAMAAMIYELLTGRQPFRAKTRTADAYADLHRTAVLEPLSVGTTPGVYDLLRRALAKLPEERLSAIDLAKALRAALDSDPVQQAHAAARVWKMGGRSPDLTWGLRAIRAVERRKPAPIDDDTGSFLRASRREGLWRTWGKRVLVALPAAAALASIQVSSIRRGDRKEAEAALARKDAESAAALVTLGEVEQGRQALLRGDTARAAEHLLEAYRRGDRSWPTEWMLARALEPAGAELARMPALKGRMWSTAISPDERQIVTTDEGGAQVWDANTYAQLYVLPHADTVYDAVYAAGGAQLVTACGDGAVRVWDAASGKLVREMRGGDARPRYAKLAAHGDLIAAIDFSGSNVYVWNATTGAVLAEIHSKGESVFLSLAFNAAGSWLATNAGEEAHLINTTTWKHVASIPGAIRSMAWDPAGERLAVGAPSGDVSVWSINGRRVAHLREIGSPVDIVAFSSDGKLLGTAERDGVARVWDVTTGAPRVQLARPSRVRSLAFDPTSTRLGVAEADGTVGVFDAESGLPIARLDGSRDAVWSLHFDSASRVLVASWDGAARVWASHSLHRVWASSQIAPQCGVLTSTAPDTRFVAIGCGRATQVWDTEKDQLLAELPAMESRVPGDFAPVLPVASEDGTRAAIAHGNTAEVYELPGGRLLRVIVHAAPVSAVAFGHGHDLVTGATDGTIQLTHEGQQSIALPSAPAGVDAVGVMPDGRVVATDAAKHLRVISSSGVAVLDAPTRSTLLRPSPDGRLITIQGNTVPSLVGRADPALLWDLRGGAKRIGELRGSFGRVLGARWIDAGVLTVGGDGAVRLWDAATGRLLRAYSVQASHFLADAAVSPDGRLLVAGGNDGLLEFWDLATGRELWSLRAHASHVVGLHFDGADLVTRGFGGELARWHLTPAGQAIRGMVSK